MIPSRVNFTSAAVNGLPSCHLAFCRSLNVQVRPSADGSQEVARSPTTFIVPGSYLVRVLQSGLAAMTVANWPGQVNGFSVGSEMMAIDIEPPCFGVPWAGLA